MASSQGTKKELIDPGPQGPEYVGLPSRKMVFPLYKEELMTLKGGLKIFSLGTLLAGALVLLASFLTKRGKGRFSD